MKDFKPYIISAITLIFAGIFIAGCIDTPENPSDDLTGFIYTARGLPAVSTDISIDDYPIVYSDHYGKFQLPKSGKPYNIVFDAHDYNPIKYLGLTSDNPKVNIFDERFGGTGFNIIVTVPPYGENQVLILKFISDDLTYSEGEKRRWTGDTVIGMGVYFDPGYQSTGGKLIYLLVTVDYPSDQIVSYDAYGIKDVTLTYNVYNNFLFTPVEISYNPEEVNSNVLIEAPPSEYNECIFYIHLNGKNKNNDIYLESFYEPFSTVILPVLPIADYKIKTISEYFFEIYSEIGGSKWTYTNPGENIHIIHKEPLKLINPVNDQTGITDTTRFIVEDDGIKGVYVFNITGYTNVITDKNIITLADFESRGFKIRPNDDYLWSAVKIPGYNTIDEFTSVNYIFDDRYDYIQISDHRTFMTGNF